MKAFDRESGLPPLVSVVVPTYNQVRYVAATLDHVLQQDYPRLEVIVTDDGSTDGTRELLQDYVARIPIEDASFASKWDGTQLQRVHHRRYPEGRTIRLLLQDRNAGATANYNHGLRAMTGEFGTFIAGDDLPHPSMISTLVERLQESGADFAYSDMFIVNDEGRILRRFSLPEYDFERSLADWYLLGVSKLYRVSLHERAGYCDEKYRVANDYDLYLRFAQAGARFVHVPRVLYSVRHHGGERKIGQHSPENERRCVMESAEIAERARTFLSVQRGEGAKPLQV